MIIQPTPLAALTKIPISLTGDWYHHPKPIWRGLAQADQPLVAIVLCTDDNGTSLAWCKSEKRLGNTCPINLNIFPVSALGLDVQIIFSAQHGQVSSRATINASDYHPRVSDNHLISTGEVIPFALIESTPRIELYLLLIVRHDVKGGRKGLWWLRQTLQNSVPEPFAKMLSYGRTGCISW